MELGLGPPNEMDPTNFAHFLEIWFAKQVFSQGPSFSLVALLALYLNFANCFLLS